MSYVYWWHDPGLSAFKLGCGFNPRQRMHRYATRHGLVYDASSLITLDCTYWKTAHRLERAMHRALRAGGWHRAWDWKARRPREVYPLNGWDYEQAVEYIKQRWGY